MVDILLLSSTEFSILESNFFELCELLNLSENTVRQEPLIRFKWICIYLYFVVHRIPVDDSGKLLKQNLEKCINIRIFTTGFGTVRG